MKNIIEDIFKKYLQEVYPIYDHEQSFENLLMIAYAHGMLGMLNMLKINPEKILFKNETNFKEHLDYILKDKFLKLDNINEIPLTKIEIENYVKKEN